MFTLAFLPRFSGWEWLIILAILILLFSKRIPGLARGIGNGILEFKKGLSS